MADLTGAVLVMRVTCPDCDGAGDLPSGDWESFEDWQQRQPRPRRPMDAFMEEAELAERYFLEVCGYDSVPPQREPCEDCDGNGRIDQQVPIETLVEFVLEQVDRPLVARPDVQEMVAQIKQTITDAALASRGLADGFEVGTWLRAVQEGAEALRSLGELQARRRL